MFSVPARWPSAALVFLVATTACGAETQPATPPAARAADGSAPALVAQAAPAEQRPPAAEPATAVRPPAPTSPSKPAPTPAAAPEPAAPQQAAPTKKPEPSRAAADAMSVNELIGRRDLWPARVAFTTQARLDATTWWKPGDELPLREWNPANVVLDEGTFLFEWEAAKTDVVERTRDLAAALTPEALALTVDTLRARPELWPTRVQLTAQLQFGGNTFVPAGREVALRFFEASDLAVYDREIGNYYTLAANETDLMTRARARLALPEAERTPFFLRSLEAALDPARPKASLAEADFVLVYSGRLGCMRCASFAPRLKEFYARAKAQAPAGARFELVFLSNDPSAESAQKYLSEAQLPGGVIAFERRLEAANLMTLELRTLPGFYVFDRDGNLVDRNHPDAGNPSADMVLAKFEERVKAK